MFAYDKHGSVFAMREGAELLVHDGESEGPLWRKTLDAHIVGLGADRERVTAITANGTVAWFPAQGGDMQSAALGATPWCAVVGDGKRRVVAATDDKILALENNVPVTLLADVARAIAMRPDGTVLVATEDDELVIIAPDGTHAKTPHELGGINALAWHPEGFWLVGATSKVWRWSGSGAPVHVTNLPDGELTHVAACKGAIAIAWNGNAVVSLAWPSRDTLASVEYLERKVEGIDFGPWPWLGIALDLGDGNKQHMLQPERLHRSDTHPGRQHHSWLVKVGGPPPGQAPVTESSEPVPSIRPGHEAGPLAPRLFAAGVVAAILLVIMYLFR